MRKKSIAKIFWGSKVAYEISLFTLPNMTYPSRDEILMAITHYYEEGALSFMETVNNVSWGYKVRLKKNLTQQNNEQRMD